MALSLGLLTRWTPYIVENLMGQLDRHTWPEEDHANGDEASHIAGIASHLQG